MSQPEWARVAMPHLPPKCARISKAPPKSWHQALQSKANTRFQSFFMLMTVQFFFFASS